MADFINREAAIKQFCDDCMDREWCKSNGESCSRINNINAVPAADVVEKKEWDKLMFLVEAANQILEAAKWISVKERLPETDGNYLVWMRWPDEEEPVVSIINFDSTAQEFGEWEDYYDPCTLGWVGSDFMKIENVYAWMPLPSTEGLNET